MTESGRDGFPEVLLDINLELDEIIGAWEKTGNPPMYDKISMKESIDKYRYLRDYKKKLSCMEDRKLVLTLITCPFDVKDREVLRLWLRYCEDPEKQQDCPMLPRDFSLEGLESYYKQLDLYTQDKGQFEKRCRICGRPLVWNSDYPICDRCYRKMGKEHI